VRRSGARDGPAVDEWASQVTILGPLRASFLYTEWLA
jgi:hypothetical protein